MTKRTPSARRAALACLRETDAGVFVDEPRRRHAATVEARERPLYFELVSGVVRRQDTLDVILEAYLQSGLRKTPDELVRALRIGVYQLLFLDRIPAHAAVAETVALLGSQKKRRLVNGVLRTLTRDVSFGDTPAEKGPSRHRLDLPHRSVTFLRPVFPDPEKNRRGHVAAQHGFRPEAVALLEDELGRERAAELLARANDRPVLTLRPDPRRLDAEGLVAALDAGEPGAVPSSVLPDHPADVVVFRGGGDPTAIAGFRDGAFTIQGPFAASIAPFVNPRAGERILDVCAPPGGKTLHLAQCAPEASITSLVLDEGGRSAIREAADRMNCANVAIEIYGGDPGTLATRYDAVLLDVPCSNSGVLARRPEARRRLDSRSLAAVREIQARLLRAVLEAELGARVFYATCSVLPSENEELVHAVTTALPAWEVVETRRAWPRHDYDDGGFVAHLRRRS